MKHNLNFLWTKNINKKEDVIVKREGKEMKITK